MVTWLIRITLAAGVAVLVVSALGGRRPTAEVAPTATPLSEPPAAPTAPAPTARPTATSERFVERIVSRISHETPAPYPTATALPAGLAIVTAVDFGYMPSVSRIKVGQTVVWQNGGRELHDVTGEDDWHSGPIEPATEYRHTFGFEGTFAYRCSVHLDMRGTIIVSS